MIEALLSAKSQPQPTSASIPSQSTSSAASGLDQSFSAIIESVQSPKTADTQTNDKQGDNSLEANSQASGNQTAGTQMTDMLISIKSDMPDVINRISTAENNGDKPQKEEKKTEVNLSAYTVLPDIVFTSSSIAADTSPPKVLNSAANEAIEVGKVPEVHLTTDSNCAAEKVERQNSAVMSEQPLPTAAGTNPEPAQIEKANEAEVQNHENQESIPVRSLTGDISGEAQKIPLDVLQAEIETGITPSELPDNGRQDKTTDAEKIFPQKSVKDTSTKPDEAAVHSTDKPVFKPPDEIKVTVSDKPSSQESLLTSGGKQSVKSNTESNQKVSAAGSKIQAADSSHKQKSETVSDISSAVSNLPDKFTVEKADATAGGKPAEKPIASQIVDYVRISLSEGKHTFKMKLNPDGLGELSVNMTMKNGEVFLELNASLPSTKIMISNQLGELRQAFQQNDIRISDFNVGVNGFADNSSQFSSFRDGYGGSHSQSFDNKREMYGYILHEKEKSIAAGANYRFGLINYRI